MILTFWLFVARKINPNWPWALLMMIENARRTGNRRRLSGLSPHIGVSPARGPSGLQERTLNSRSGLVNPMPIGTIPGALQVIELVGGAQKGFTPF